MTGPANLPLAAQVAADGRLLSADPPILRLHNLAGGVDNGVFAVPGLAAIAAQTHKIKMRLARAVYVAYGDGEAELWVESALLGDIAMLSVEGWRIIDRGSNRRTGLPGGPMPPHIAHLLFDRNLRLVELLGGGETGLHPDDIGKSVADIFEHELNDGGQWMAAMERREPAYGTVRLLHRETPPIEAGFEPQFNQQDEFSGYRCILSARPPFGAEEAHSEQKEREAASNSSEPLFGRHLAPVLRQPLGRIIANAETIGGKLQGPIRENYSSYAKDIANAARHLMALVDDLGDLEAVERPGFMTAPDEIELGDAARRVAGLLALKAADHRIDISTPASDEKVTARAEFRRVLQILINLVGNAIRYSPAGSRVSIAIEETGNAAVISVSDQGAGIAPADREKIFEKFERLGRSGDGGSGLGLYISRRLARAMGGDLWLSEPGQGGATFTLTLPLFQKSRTGQ